MALSGDRESPSCLPDFAEFAQEFLRRNGEYRRQFAELAYEREGHAHAPAARRMARFWGLEFPD